MLDLLNVDEIRAALDSEMNLTVLREIDSTNRYLGDRARQGVNGPEGCLAEYQTAGRGRHGKNWFSPFASGLCISFLWTTHNPLQKWNGLTLALGTAIADIIEQRGVQGLGLKWPNDLYWTQRKLAGLLIESIARPDGMIHLIIGLGINIHIPPGTLDMLDQPWTDLTQAGWNPCSRNQLAANLLTGLAKTLRNFETNGLAPFLELWRARDILNGKNLSIQISAGQNISGIGAGIDDQGALQIYHGATIRSFSSGEVSLRFN